ncbi:EamA family transporter [Pseudonocardiaceae bacterium YIM PH 21723]|nr:EamA family transporter [Pseudonocardiaceae bacterium YIM PH 21723]
MHSLALSMLVAAAVLHAVWNFAAKRVGGGGAVFVWWYSVIASVVCLPFAIGELATMQATPHWSWLVAAIGTAVLHIAYGIALQRGYTIGDMSVVYPLARGTGPLLSVIAAVLLFGEHPGLAGLLGALAVVLGVLVISINPSAGGPGLTSVGYGVLTGATIAAYTLWDAHAVNGAGMPPLAYYTAGCVLQSLMLTPHVLANRPEMDRLRRDHRRELWIVGVLSSAAYVLVLYAMRTTPISVVAPVRELSIVLGSLAAWRILGEPNPARRLVGASIVLAGIVGIAAG